MGNEQWMGPDIRHPCYSKSSNAECAHRLQDDQRLLLVVGEVDDNVDPCSTLRVVGALQAAGKFNFELCMVVGQGHSAADSRYGDKKRSEFLLRHLRKQEKKEGNVRAASPAVPAEPARTALSCCIRGLKGRLLTCGGLRQK